MAKKGQKAKAALSPSKNEAQEIKTPEQKVSASAVTPTDSLCGDSGGSPCPKPVRVVDLNSPPGRSLAAWYEKPDDQLNYFIGDSNEQEDVLPGSSTATVELRLAFKGLCSEYFELHVSPMLRLVQQSQEHQYSQIQELRAALERKADRSDVPAIGQLQDLVAAEVTRRSDSMGVSTLVRLKELSTLVQKKADSSSVPTLAQFNNIATRIDQKLDVKDAVSSLRLEEVLSSAREEARQAVDAAFAELELSIKKAEATLREHLEKQVREMSVSSKAVQPTDSNSATNEVKKMQLVVAAAGARFDKQIRDLKQQIKQLREDGMKRSISEEPDDLVPATPRVDRWPGRNIHSKTPSEAGSDAGSAVLSLAGSLASGLGEEERAELRKIQAVVGAAGTAFSRDLRELRKQLREVNEEVQKLKSQR